MDRTEDIGNIRHADDKTPRNGDQIGENLQILRARRIKWFHQKFEREMEKKSKEKRSVEYLGGVEGVTVGDDGKITIDPGVSRSRWGKWLGKKLVKEGDEKVKEYLVDRQKRCDLAQNVVVPGRRKQQGKTVSAESVDKKNNEKTKRSSSQQHNVRDKTDGAPTNTKPGCTADKVVVAEACGPKHSTKPPKTRDTTDNPTNTEPTGPVDKVVAVEESTPKYDPESTKARDTTDNSTNTEPVGPVDKVVAAEESTTKPETKPTVAASPAGDVNRKKTAVEVYRPKRTSRRAATACKIIVTESDTTGVTRREIYFDTALLRSLWGQWMAQMLRNMWRMEKGACAREIGYRQLAIDTTQIMANCRIKVFRKKNNPRRIKGKANEKVINAPIDKMSTANNADTVAAATGITKPKDNAAMETALNKAAMETALNNAAMETALNKAAMETALNNAAMETARDKDTMETALNKAAMETALNKAAMETARDKATMETALNKATMETALNNGAMETARDKATMETALNKAAMETALNKATMETALNKATMETALDKAAMETERNKATMETALDKAAMETALNKATMETALDKAAMKTPPATDRIKGATDNALRVAETGGMDATRPTALASPEDGKVPMTDTIDADKTTRDGDTIKPTTEGCSVKVADATRDDDDAAVDTILQALCGHFGDDIHSESIAWRRDDVTEAVTTHDITGPYTGAYSHEYDWIFGNNGITDRGGS